MYRWRAGALARCGMAQYVPMPQLPQETPPPGVRIPWSVIFHWLVEVLKFLVLILFPFKNYDAKLSILVGDDVKRSVGVGWFPGWATAMESAFTGLVSEKLDEGVLARKERDFAAGTKEWVTIFRMLKAFLSGIHNSLGGGVQARSLYYRGDTESLNLLTDVIDSYRKERQDGEVVLDTPQPDLAHLIATLVAMLSIADRIPYAALNIETVDKSASSDEPPVKTTGTIADVLAEKALEFLTRTDHLVSVRAVRKEAGG